MWISIQMIQLHILLWLETHTLTHILTLIRKWIKQKKRRKKIGIGLYSYYILECIKISHTLYTWHAAHTNTLENLYRALVSRTQYAFTRGRGLAIWFITTYIFHFDCMYNIKFTDKPAKCCISYGFLTAWILDLVFCSSISSFSFIHFFSFFIQEFVF